MVVKLHKVWEYTTCNMYIYTVYLFFKIEDYVQAQTTQ